MYHVSSIIPFCTTICHVLEFCKMYSYGMEQPFRKYGIEAVRLVCESATLRTLGYCFNLVVILRGNAGPPPTNQTGAAGVERLTNTYTNRNWIWSPSPKCGTLGYFITWFLQWLSIGSDKSRTSGCGVVVALFVQLFSIGTQQ